MQNKLLKELVTYQSNWKKSPAADFVAIHYLLALFKAPQVRPFTAT